MTETASHPQHFDCAIIGGGLAGLTLAIRLQRKGLRVVLFEKEQYPFHKVCGEYIAMESWNYLEDCGADLGSMDLPRITQLQVSAPNGNTLEHTLSPGGFGISRYTLDQRLAAVAKRDGVLLLDHTKVQWVTWDDTQFHIQTPQRSFTAEIALGAFGKRSNLDVKLKRKFIQRDASEINYVGVKYHVKADLPQDLIGLHNFTDGYCGISKVDGDAYCLCYLTTSHNLKKSNNNIREMEEKILGKNPFLRRYFNEFPVLYDEPLAISQISFAPKQCVEEHILMLGDAAGLIAPLCGNGMSMALHASKMLSELVPLYFSKQLTRAQLENRYSSAWEEQFRARLRTGRYLQQLFGNDTMTNITIAALKPFPFLVSKLVSLTHGKPF